jgi:glycerol-3-phosphate cytidylyltransferase
MTEVLTVGTFDTPHLGHARLFKTCEALGNLTVGVNSDEFIEQYKGKRPLFTFEERATLISRLGYRVLINNSAGAELIREVNPDILVIGSDWLRKDYLKQIDMTPDDFDELGISLMYTPYTEGISSTDIKRRVDESYRNRND